MKISSRTLTVTIWISIGLVFFDATEVSAAPEPGCNDPDFVCHKACKHAKTSKSRRLKRSKSAKKSNKTVYTCDWIEGLSPDTRAEICDTNQRGTKISDSCPEACRGTTCENVRSEPLCPVVLDFEPGDSCPFDEITECKYSLGVLYEEGEPFEEIVKYICNLDGNGEWSQPAFDVETLEPMTKPPDGNGESNRC